ncbi:hypothetical protein K439DRAFT_1639102 [Ramaria rubella]|nr:hypothetical protein K439DRAFT_1639102 [Ramaria rubella]
MKLDGSDDEDTPQRITGGKGLPAWKHHFYLYIDAVDDVPEGTSIVEWWGVSFESCISNSLLIILVSQLMVHRYSTWASLAHDYLPIMASCVE